VKFAHISNVDECQHNTFFFEETVGTIAGTPDQSITVPSTGFAEITVSYTAPSQSKTTDACNNQAADGTVYDLFVQYESEEWQCSNDTASSTSGQQEPCGYVTGYHWHRIERDPDSGDNSWYMNENFDANNKLESITLGFSIERWYMLQYYF
jgi:hypothetical protein